MSDPSPNLPTAPVVFDTIREALRDLAQQSLSVLFPVDVPAGGLTGRDGYCSVKHAELCRAKFLGLSDRASARLVGLSPDTVRAWRKRYPKLDHDMDQARESSNAHAALLLRGLMEGGGPTAFQAIKFFLSTHSPEFREVQDVNLHVDVGQTIRHIRTGLYGLPEPAPAELPAEPAGEAAAKEEAETSDAAARSWDDL